MRKPPQTRGKGVQRCSTRTGLTRTGPCRPALTLIVKVCLSHNLGTQVSAAHCSQLRHLLRGGLKLPRRHQAPSRSPSPSSPYPPREDSAPPASPEGASPPPPSPLDPPRTCLSEPGIPCAGEEALRTETRSLVMKAAAEGRFRPRSSWWGHINRQNEGSITSLRSQSPYQKDLQEYLWPRT